MTGYILTESSSTPSLNDSHWVTTAPTTYTFQSQGSKTLYAWARDAAGNISSSLSASVSIIIGHHYVYDELNRLIQVLYEDGRQVTYTYDAAGNRMTLTHD